MATRGIHEEAGSRRDHDSWETFSLMRGGPLRRLQSWAGLPRGNPGLIDLGIAITVLTWLPLLVLSAVDHTLTSGPAVPFLYSIGTHVRLLGAIPLLFAGEALFDQRVREVIRTLVGSEVVPARELPRLGAALRRVKRWTDGSLVEALLVAITIFLIWRGIRTDLPGQISTWRTTRAGELTLAGFWYIAVSLPLFQFLALRWCLRLLIWFYLLWRINRLDLHLVASHPDFAGGLGAVGVAYIALTPLCFVASSIIVATFAEQLLYGGALIRSVVLPLAVTIIGITSALVAPLLLFTPRLIATRYRGLLHYGVLASSYTRAFESKWLKNEAPPTEGLLGSADVQSLADLSNSFQVIQSMRDRANRKAAADTAPRGGGAAGAAAHLLRDTARRADHPRREDDAQHLTQWAGTRADGSRYSMTTMLKKCAALLSAGLWIAAVPGFAAAQPARPPSETLPPAASDSAPQERARPKIGLALGGGAARGIAHIGLLRWFEMHRIPVDYIAGTSMGGLIGGAYASGLTPDEIQALMNDADWDLMFLADSPFRHKTFRRKEDARAFPGQIDFGLKGGFKLPSGLNAGQQIEMLLDRIALPYHDLRSFDELPTPFRCVATDIRKGEPLVMSSGSFARALRATMAIPAVFTPVVLDQQLLVDGGALNNVPADVVKAMGANVAIAVNVSSSTDEAPAPTTLFAVLGQTLDSMMTTGTRQALKSADLVIVPDLKGLTGSDWRRTNDLVAQGFKAAEAVSADLLRYQIDEATYAEWSRARQARRRDRPRRW